MIWPVQKEAVFILNSDRRSHIFNHSCINICHLFYREPVRIVAAADCLSRMVPRLQEKGAENEDDDSGIVKSSIEMSKSVIRSLPHPVSERIHLFSRLSPKSQRERKSLGYTSSKEGGTDHKKDNEKTRS